MNDDDQSVEHARREVIEAMEQSAELYGLNRSHGRLYGILFFQDEPISLDDLVEQSGYAKSTVSTAMRNLERVHLVHRRSIPGEGKKAFYEAERDFWHVVQQFLRGEVQQEIDIMTRTLESAREQLEAVDDERAAQDLERIRSLERMYSHSETLVGLLTNESIERLIKLLDR
jgi:DNA-binding transcriptional regulator GbsR (MarR family)